MKKGLIKIDRKVVDDINTFTRLSLEDEKYRARECFSDPDREDHWCNPDTTLKHAKEPTCAIYWICHCYLGARLGIGLSGEESYDLNKSLSFTKALTWKQLSKAIDLTLKGDSVDIEELEKEARKESQIEQLKRAEKIVQEPKKKKEKKKKSVVSKLAKKMGYNQNTVGRAIIKFLHDKGPSTKKEIVDFALKKGWKRLKKIEDVINQCIENNVVIEDNELYKIRS